MMKVLTSCALIACATAANADSLNEWNGPYVGAAVTYADAETTVLGNRFTYNQNQSVNLVEHAYDGLGVSALFGWNARKGNWVATNELSFGMSDLSSNLVFNSDDDIDQVEISWDAALTGRFGYVLRDTLVYFKGGLTLAQIRNIGGDVNGGELTLSDAHDRDDVRNGTVLALGLERYFGASLIGRVEYSKTTFGSYREANEDGAVPGSQFYIIDNGPIDQLSIGLIYSF